ncbi:DNA repair protein RecO [Haploplasma axanthum]|uniref:Recombination protein O n=1 Tax=Haploplasma axanthum TaxID=29552 RepID=A0A449BEZ9_HAPAX|nr:DNA repair protein RecO [Haploplasma axanthum]VEU81002.1 Recombination protein O [Haploplasma axanthum]
MNNLEGLVFKVQAYQESNRLLQVFTKLGKISLKVTGAQKMNNNSRVLAQNLTQISFEYTDLKSFLTLKNGKIINDFKDIKNDYQRTKDASLTTEIIGRVLVDDFYNEKVYEMLIEALEHENIKISSLSFALKVLYYLGYGMDLKGNGNKIKGFNIKRGSVVYIDENIELDLNYEETIELLKLTYTKISNLEDIKGNTIDIIKKFTYNYYLDKLDIRLKTLE